MNLVIDDAIEVKQVSKTNDKETRRPLGMNSAMWARSASRFLIVLQARSC